MFENEWFPKASVMGITWEEFWKMNPHIINCIANGYREKQIEQDSLMHVWWGTYGLSAVSVAIEHCLSGKKAKSKYVEKPIMSKMQEKIQAEKPLTEEEKKRQTEILFTKLQVLGANHKLKNKNDKK